jgi:hypothetical protein
MYSIRVVISKDVPEVYIQTNEYRDNNPVNSKVDVGNEKLENVIFFLAQELSLVTENSSIESLLQKALESDDLLLNHYINLNDKTDKMDLIKTIKPYLRQLKSDTSHLQNTQGASEEVLEYLNRCRNEDIFATLMDIIYSIIISKVFIIASEIGTNQIILVDTIGISRLRTRFILAAQEMEIDLKFEELKEYSE